MDLLAQAPKPSAQQPDLAAFVAELATAGGGRLPGRMGTGDHWRMKPDWCGGSRGGVSEEELVGTGTQTVQSRESLLRGEAHPGRGSRYGMGCSEPMAAVNRVTKRPAGTGGGGRRCATEGAHRPPGQDRAGGPDKLLLEHPGWQRGSAGICGSLCPFSTSSWSFSSFIRSMWSRFRLYW
jgi:hypothetical protein